MWSSTFLIVACSSCILGAAKPALASSFDPATGRLSLDDAAFADGLDALDTRPDGLAWMIWGWDDRPRDAATAFRADPLALEGAGHMRLDAVALVFSFLPSLPTLVGRRVELRFWMRARGTLFQAQITFVSGDERGYFLVAADRGFVVSSVAFAPTGRATDDGWIEMSTGPFDYALAGVLEPAAITLWDSQDPDGTHADGLQAIDRSLTADLDAFEIVDLGPAAVPAVACTVLDERALCGEAGLCLMGRCADAGALDGGIPPAGPTRSDYVARRTFELLAFHGGRDFRAVTDAFEALMQVAATGPPRDFLASFRAAYELAANVHAVAPIWGRRGLVDLGVCLNLGLADLVPEDDLPDSGLGDRRLAPLVFSIAPRSPLGQVLARGDVLVAIDGVPVETWRAAAARVFTYYGEAANRPALAMPGVMNAAAWSGSELTFLRCPEPAGCSADTLEVIQVDLGALIGERVWADQVPPQGHAGGVCDFRFHQAVPDPRSSDGGFMGSRQEGDVTFVQFNDMPLSGADGAWRTALGVALSAAPPKVLIDHRLGSGGASDLVWTLANHLMARSDRHQYEAIPWLGVPLSDTLLGKLRACWAMYGNRTLCGEYQRRVMPDAPVPGAAATSRLAVLMGRDASSSEMFLRGLDFRQAPTRTFGSAATHGSFGIVCTLAPILGEWFGGRFQCNDFAYATRDLAADELVFESGRGVRPDVLVYQTQRDAILDRDTLIEAALTWLGEEDP